MGAGVLFSFLAALALNSGNVVQKHAVTSLPEFSARRGRHLIRTLLSSRTWMLGFILCVAGVVFQVMAFALAPIAVVQSIFNACIVLLIVLSRLRLGERLGAAEWTGLAVVVASVVAISTTLTGSSNAVAHAGSQLNTLMAVVPTLIIVAIMIDRIRPGQSINALLYGVASGLLYGSAALGAKGASTLLARHGVSASIPLIVMSIYPYVFIICSVAGMVVYQTGIQRFRIAVVGTMSDVVNSTFVVAVGSIVFYESLPKDHAALALRLCGFVGVLAGSVLVAFGGHEHDVRLPPMSEADIGLGPVIPHRPGSVPPEARGAPAPRPVPDLYELLRHLDRAATVTN